MSLNVDQFVQKLEADGQAATTPEGYKNFVADALALTQRDLDFQKAVMERYHKDGANNKHLPCLSILVHSDAAGVSSKASVQTFESIKKGGACSADPVFSKASGFYYEK